MSTMATDESVRLEAEIDGFFTTFGESVAMKTHSVADALHECRAAVMDLVDTAGQETI